ncbi:hypothetical protein TYRP_000449 [Tyrophagus putrescentiae]|nr:hypothetical protein TYRP_000449 [Tyrophagus putrescentiae]
MYNSAETGTYGQDGFDAFSSKTVRLGFIRKVYGILSVQLLITLGFVCAFSLSDGARKWTRQNQWLFWVAFGTTLVTIIMLTCCENFRRKTPHNYVALMVFTFAESFMVGVISSMYYYKIVLTAVLITAVICLALTIFRIDFTVYNGLLFVLLIVLMLFGLIASFWRDGIVHLIYSCLGALLFSAYLVVDTQMIVGGTHKFQISSEEYYLVVDTQMIVGGSHKYQISQEEYVFAALTLYLDIINVFLYLLSILQSLSSE